MNTETTPQRNRPLEWPADERRVGPKPPKVFQLGNRRIGLLQHARTWSSSERRIGKPLAPEVVDARFEHALEDLSP